MSRPMPSVVIVGRPNVGKSTLFNAIIGSRRAIVGDEPGITRDRIHGDAEYRGKLFRLVDTGGIVANDPELIPSEILRQARVALQDAGQIIFLVDGRSELTAPDRELGQLLRRLGKPVTLAVNKIDVPKREILAQEFHELGFDALFPVSAEHRLGLDDLLDHVTKDFETREDAPAEPTRRIKVAIIGRPNVGKSTLLNALVGHERTIVSPVPGTTRDAVDETIVRDGVEYVFVDTAGIRRKGKTRLMAEKLSVVMARRHIGLADVVLLVLDAADGVVSQDATIGGYAHESGRITILCVNKWDIAPKKDKAAFVDSARRELKFLDYAPIAFLSAASGAGVAQLFGLIRRGYEAASQRVTTGELNRFLESLKLDMNLRARYMTQASVRPPTFVVFSDGSQKLHFSKERYLANQLRKRFGFEGAPVVVKTKTKPRRAG
ncbi:MAG: ribosome biogenesis GTPase Der [Bryobacteraceae bacterium]|nr:ribosome biogenesis GTPase Der [Bryobacteraceae bacterium]